MERDGRESKRVAQEGAHGQGRQGAQVAQGAGGPLRFFAMSIKDIDASNSVVTDIIIVNSHGAYALIDPGSMYS
ncbi:hypothetical protein HAX54_026011, partial [Datura stramonium]|nr:hypothetical protein [Datura stramonium]